MAERDASQVQLDFPQLTADVIRVLRLTGTLGLFNMSDTVIPVISVGNVRPQTFSFSPIVFESAEVFFGDAPNAAANTIIADTGALAAGTYDIQGALSMAASVTGPNSPLVIEHRNAANAATLATLLSISITTTRMDESIFLPLMGYVIGLNERLRIKSPSILISGTAAGLVMAALRPTP